jgi:hypothetical protein
MPTLPGGVTGAAARRRHRQHGPVNEASTQLGDAGLLRPIAPFERIEMLVEAVAPRRKPQLVLNAMEQAVKQYLLTCVRILLREHARIRSAQMLRKS